MKSDQYSPASFRVALAYYDSAMTNWSAQNEKLIFLRRYDDVISFANKSEEYSVMAMDQARLNSASIKDRLETRMRELKKIVESLGELFVRYPIPSEVRNRLTRGRLLLSEAEVAFENSSFLQANRKITDADHLIRYSLDYAVKSLEEYFTSYKHWKVWLDRTVEESRVKKIPVIIVDKIAGKCYLYNKGVKTGEFDAEFGPQWIGDKRHRGDRATPEGIYHVTRKLEGASTKYYKALLINYPNEDDQNRFRAEIRDGSLPSSAKIGGLIEIHGHGGKGRDWTDGCVALTDRDMDILFRQVRVGTPVTIIGSVSAPEEVMRRINEVR
ncbi:MAG: L,D-transpeptidase family protein [Bacteroidales bacterium]|nr:L,D-transpeptidase family protein [Bacteroidales bacterium]